MIDFPYLSEICEATPSRILMLVVDGLGGLPHPDTQRSELETANIPNLNRLAQRSACGLTTPVLPGIAPGSGPGHLALFGYDPLKYLIGRGALEAIGIELPLQEGDVAARGNFCTVNAEGQVVDRRAGRISSEESTRLCQALNRIQVSGVAVQTHPVKEHRFVLLLRGQGLSERVSETDPQRTGVTVPECRPLAPEAQKTARAIKAWVAEVRALLRERPYANMVMLRGFSQLPTLPSMAKAYRLNPVAIAAYPMYRGLAKLLDMRVIPAGDTFETEVEALERSYTEHDFFYLHYKPADAAGEDGDFQGKVRALEELDRFIPQLLALNPDVLLVAGDHATPAILAAHSWHPVPLLLHSKWTRGEGVPGLNERACAQGSLGRISATHIMLLALAHAGKLVKFGP